MIKEYFSHDYDSCNDPQLAAMVGEFKAEGYGIYWRIIELLHKEGGYLAFDMVSFTAISRSIDSDVETVKNLIQKSIDVYKLFFLRNKKFSSKRVLKNLRKREDIKSVRSKAGIASAEKRKTSTHVEHVSTHVEQNPTKQRKGKESKEYIEEGVSAEFLQSMELTTDEVDMVKQYLSLTKKVDLPAEQVQTLFAVFKKKRASRSSYKYDSEVFPHFMETLKFEKFDHAAHNRSSSPIVKLGTSEARIKRAKEW